MKRVAALVFVLLAAACGGGGDSAAVSADVVLEAAAGSGVDGRATITRASPTSATIIVAAELGTAAEIVGGECDGFAPPVVIRKLGALSDGQGTFTVPLSFEELTGTGYTVAVKRGAEYVACGSIVP